MLWIIFRWFWNAQQSFLLLIIKNPKPLIYYWPVLDLAKTAWITTTNILLATSSISTPSWLTSTRCNVEPELNPRDAFYGRTNACKFRITGKKIRYIDMISLYPRVMFFSISISHPIRIKLPQQYDNSWFSPVKYWVDFTIPCWRTRQTNFCFHFMRVVNGVATEMINEHRWHWRWCKLFSATKTWCCMKCGISNTLLRDYKTSWKPSWKFPFQK